MTTSDLRSHLTNPAAVCIARGRPRAWVGRLYLDLAPTWALLKGSIADYHVGFAAILAKRDPRKVLADLGPEAILCCWERPFDFCHRRVVAEWLEAALGLEIPELGYSRAETPAWRAMNFGAPTPPAKVTKPLPPQTELF